MKTILPSMKMLALALIIFSTQAKSQSGTELVFDNPNLLSGTNGADNAIYLFPKVIPSLDAQVKITGRSSALVTLSTIDATGLGFKKAFQPQIQYNGGNATGAITWWMEFQISFFDMGTSNPASIQSFSTTGIDIDGNGSNLREWDAFYGAAAYTVENITSLTTNSVTGTIGQPALTGKQFIGSLADHAGIDTVATDIMATASYVNANSITIRIGATTTASTSGTQRNYSVYFKGFNYTSPITLPVKLSAFTAMLSNNNRVDLKWTTSYEKNVSHFVIEKSLDGRNYNDAGMVFAYGNTTSDMNYMYADNMGNSNVTVVYYRLRAVDVDGKFEYSDVRVIRINKTTENNITILTYPNPVSSELRITIPANWQNKQVSYELFNANGQSSRKSIAANASQTETLNVSNLAPGFYIVRVSCEGTTVQQKIVKN